MRRFINAYRSEPATAAATAPVVDAVSAVADSGAAR